MLESKIEREYVRWCKLHGMLCLKQNANWYANISDRLVVIGCHAFFLELKRPGEDWRPGQLRRARIMRERGYTVHLADDLDRAIEITLGEMLLS